MLSSQYYENIVMTGGVKKLFVDKYGVEPLSIVKLSGAGSNRVYYRLHGDGFSVIAVVGTSFEENRAFVALADAFAKSGVDAPEVLAVSDDGLCYLQTDLGDTTLFESMKQSRENRCFAEDDVRLLCDVMSALPRIQYEVPRHFDFSLCYPMSDFNERTIKWDLNYFKYCFLKATGLDFQEDKLENEFERLAYILLNNSDMTAFMYRDFQSRNVMVVKDENGEEVPYFIDFQGGRKGPVYYDVASFLWQAKANFHPDLREELVELYIEEMQKFLPVDREVFYDTLKHFVLFRTMQVLGAYGFRGYFEKKPHFLQSIPFAIDNLRHLLKHASEDYPYLIQVLKEMTAMKQFKDVGMRKPLVVRIFSFSYKKGIPADSSGNGGGFVFDCRAVNNPGKYERYQFFTGMDEPVITFLEEDGEIIPFLEQAYQLVDFSVKRYMDRGFQNLMVSFGCTGGQHRSVYAAEKMAAHINEKFGVEVQLIHREQNIERVLDAKD